MFLDLSYLNQPSDRGCPIVTVACRTLSHVDRTPRRQRPSVP